MNVKRILPALICLPMMITLAGCPVKRTNYDDSDSNFFVSVTHQNRVQGYLPTGSGWKPGSKVEISLFNEPNGTGGVNQVWRRLFTVTVDPSSMFGFNQGAPFHPVRRIQCGVIPNNQTVVFLAKNLDTGKIRMQHVLADLYFTFNPCP